MEQLLTTTLASPIGKLYILTRGELLLGLNLSGYSDLITSLTEDELGEKIEKRKTITGISERIACYFDGEFSALNPIKVRQSGGDFSQAAWAAMRKIKAGKTESYAELATRAGSPAAVRAAGTACARNKIAIVIPCHRIIKSGGALGAYGWGVEKKLWLLKHEGALE